MQGLLFSESIPIHGIYFGDNKGQYFSEVHCNNLITHDTFYSRFIMSLLTTSRDFGQFNIRGIRCPVQLMAGNKK